METFRWLEIPPRPTQSQRGRKSKGFIPRFFPPPPSLAVWREEKENRPPSFLGPRHPASEIASTFPFLRKGTEIHQSLLRKALRYFLLLRAFSKAALRKPRKRANSRYSHIYITRHRKQRGGSRTEKFANRKTSLFHFKIP